METLPASHLSAVAYELFSTYVAGLMYDNNYRHVRNLQLRQEVWLCREPDNAHDPHAIRVETLNGERFGYIPRDLANVIAPIMDTHQTPGITGRVIELSSDANGNSFRTQICFYLPHGWIPSGDDTPALATSDHLDYHYYIADSTGVAYLLLDCDEDICLQVYQLLTEADQNCTRHGLSYQPGPNGHQYQWYIRFADGCRPEEEYIASFMREQFGIIPEEQRIAELQHDTEQLRAETQNLSEELERLRTQGEEAREQRDQLQRLLDSATANLERKTKALDEISRDVEFRELRRRDAFNDDLTPKGDMNRDALEDLIVDKLGDRLTPELALVVIEWLFPERVVILESAKRSAKDAEKFKYPRRLTELLWKLATEYWTALNTERGDTSARGIFGENYAAHESDDVENSVSARNRRVFKYQGQPLTMMRHLKIGVKHSPYETIRVHFEWAPEDRKIVVGHCGKHL